MARQGEIDVITDIISGLEENLESERAEKEPEYKRQMEEELRRQKQKLRNLTS